MSSESYPDRLLVPATVIGVGGIGSTLTPMLVRAGVKNITLWDNDIVEDKNLEMQNFCSADVGKSKVRVISRLAFQINSSVKAVSYRRRFTGTDILDGLVVSAVDSIESRSVIFEAVQKHQDAVPLFVDARLTRQGDFLDIYFIDPASEEEMENYKAGLFEKSLAHKSPRADCMTAHVPYMLSGLIGEALAEWAKDRRHPWKMTYDAVAHHTERYYAAAN